MLGFEAFLVRPNLAGRHGISAEIAKNGLCWRRGRNPGKFVCAGFTATKRFPNMTASGFRLEQLARRTIPIGMRVIEGKEKRACRANLLSSVK
jgi:hypothetical protein